MEELFQSIGLSESKARDTLKNVSVSNALKSYILQVYTCIYTTVSGTVTVWPTCMICIGNLA